jgi:hypothetical protein
VIEDVIMECAREGAAISQGQILVRTEEGLAPLPWQPGVEHENDFLRREAGASRWRCIRDVAESWEKYVARSTTQAITEVRTLVGAARYEMSGALYVDIAWVTPDEMELFELPGYERAALDRVIATGDPFRPGRRPTRASLAKPVAGSFHGGPAEDARTIPGDARFAWVNMRAKGIQRLATLERLDVLSIDSPTTATERHLEELGRLRVLSVDTMRPDRCLPLSRLASLEVLRIGTWRRPGALEALRDASRLRVLEVGELGVTTLDPLSVLGALRGLHVNVRRPVRTLAPLAALQQLLTLRFWGGVEDGSLLPIASLRALRRLELRTSSFALEQFAELAVALPDTEGEHRAPFREAMGWQIQLVGCKHCGTPASHYTLGKPSRMMCAKCDGHRIAQHVATWEILVSAAAARRAADERSQAR